MKHILVLIILLSSSMAWSGNTANLNKEGIILNGYDPVSYFLQKEPQLGNSQFQYKLNEIIYLFSSEANRQIFMKDPHKYEPQFGGWCAYAVADSKSKVEVDPKSYLIQDGRLLLFYNGVWANTRKKWLHTKNKEPKTYLQEADQNWQEVKTKEP